MSSTPHVDELARLVKAGLVNEAKAYHKQNKEVLLEECLIIHEQSSKKDGEK